MTVKYVDDLKSPTPARVNWLTGEISINSKVWNKLPEAYRNFILEHEIGHYTLNTRDEFAADNYAFEHFAGTQPYSLRNSIKTMSEVFSFTKPEQYARLEAQIKRALKYDYEHNQNLKAKQLLDKLNDNEMINNNDENALGYYADFNSDQLNQIAGTMKDTAKVSEKISIPMVKKADPYVKPETILGIPKTAAIIIAVVIIAAIMFFVLKKK